MPTILEALRMKDGGNTPADTIMDFLRDHRSSPLTVGDSTIASYISNSSGYDPIAPIISNDSQARYKRIAYDATQRTYKVPLTAMTRKYKDVDLHGLYYFQYSNSIPSIEYPEGDEEFYFTIKDANDVIYRVPGAYTRAGSGIDVATFYDTFVIPNKGKLAAYVYGHKTTLTKPFLQAVVSIPWETADEIIIKSFDFRKVMPL